jgi:dihydropyrimidine dehydrogenase (NAD+) subunit PreA
MRKSSLAISFLGMDFPNPFLLASGPPTARAQLVIDAFHAGWGGVVLKTISLAPTPPPSPRVHVIRSGKLKWGMLDIELFSTLTVEEWKPEIQRMREAFPDRPIIASIAGDDTEESWRGVVRHLEPWGVSAFELNTSCPNFSEGVERGSKLGQDAKTLSRAVGWVRAATDLPVIVKMTPNVTDLSPLVEAARGAGADGFCATNSLSGLGGIDLQDFSPLPSVDGKSIIGGYGGPGLRPVATRCVADIVRAAPVPVFGVGGVSKWGDAVEYFAYGAAAVQVCTAVMLEGTRIIERLTRGLATFLARRKAGSLGEIIGRALPDESRAGLLKNLGASATPRTGDSGLKREVGG